MVKEMREIKKGKCLPGDWHLRKSTPDASDERDILRARIKSYRNLGKDHVSL